jgi:hypothetical protein
MISSCDFDRNVNVSVAVSAAYVRGKPNESPGSADQATLERLLHRMIMLPCSVALSNRDYSASLCLI